MQFLLADSGIGGLMTALGVDWRVLLLNATAFLVIVWVMGRFVYPPLIKALDAKQHELEATARAKEAADEHLRAAQAEATKIIAEARGAAEAVLADARDEADEHRKAAEHKAEAQAERIVTEAREQLSQEVVKARQDLKAETAKLVASATEVILGEKLNDQRDAALVARSLEGRS